MNIAGNLAKEQPKFTKLAPVGRWVRRAACRGEDTDLWFRENHAGGSYQDARAVCAICQVTSECLDWALETKTEHGVFGGLTPRERKQLQVRRRRHELEQARRAV